MAMAATAPIKEDAAATPRASGEELQAMAVQLPTAARGITMKTLHVIDEGELSMLRITRANLASLLKAENLTSRQKETVNDAIRDLKFAG
jgi:hypothetical protein